MYIRTHALMNEAGDPAGGGGGAAAQSPAPAPTPAPAPAPNPASAPAPAPTPAPAPAPAAWHDGFTDASLKEWVSATGLDSAERAAAKAWNLEKLLGADRAGRTVVLPSDPADMKAWEPVFAKLGRPETPDGYKLDVPAGNDPSFAKSAAGWFHKAGISQAQAAMLATEWNTHVAGQVQAMQAAEQQALQAEHEALNAEWGTGPAAEEQRTLAKRGALALGLDEAAIDGIQKAVGFKKTMIALAKMGKANGEAPAEGLNDGGQSQFAMTPGDARAQKARLTADPTWRAKYLNGDATARAEMERIDRVLAAHAPRI